MANIINRPIIDREITAFPCTFKKNRDILRVYFYFQSMQDGFDINTSYVLANVTIGGSNQAINGTRYEPFKVWQDNENLLNIDRYYIEIPSALVTSGTSQQELKCFTLNTVVDVELMTLSNNIKDDTIAPDFFNILQNRIWHRDWNEYIDFINSLFNDGGKLATTTTLIDNNTIALRSNWSAQVSFHAIAQPKFTTWGGLTSSQVAESYSLSEDAKQSTELSGMATRLFDAGDKYIFKCELSFDEEYEDDQLETYEVKLYGLGSKNEMRVIQVDEEDKTVYATLIELESTDGKAFLDTRWDKTRRMFRHTLNYNFLQDAFNAYQLVITYYTMQGYKETHNYIIKANIDTENETSSYNDFCFTFLEAQPIESKGVIHLTAKLRDMRVTPVQELGVLVIERAEDINIGLDEDTGDIQRLKWYSCYESNHRAICTWNNEISTLDNSVYDEVIEYDDISAEPGVLYRYRMRFKIWKGNSWQYASYIDGGKKLNYIEADNTSILFVEDIFLATRDLTLKIRYNPDLTTYKRNVVDAITPTLGSAYPFIRRNGAQIYRTFNIGGLISYNAELYEPKIDNIQRVPVPQNGDSIGKAWISSEAGNDKFYQSLFIKGNSNSWQTLARYDKLVEQGIIDKEQKRVLYERFFRNMVIDFLYNDQVLLFKSLPEGNIFVRLSNVQLIPNKQLDRHIYSFSATATEVLETSPDNYLKYFSPTADGKESNVQNIYLVAGYYAYDNGALFVGDTEENITQDPLNSEYLIAPTWNKNGTTADSDGYTNIDLHLVLEEKETEWGE